MGKRKFLFTAAATLLWAAIAPAPAAADDAPAWTVDPAESRIVFVGRQMRVPTEGRFVKFAATIRFDPANLAGSAADIEIDMPSATTGNGMIDKELRKEAWFAVEHHPTARFTTTGFRHLGDDRYEAPAKLMLRGTTADVTLPFTLKIADDPKDSTRRVARAAGELAISRLRFGIGQGEWADTSIVADEVVIRIGIVAYRPK